MYALPNESCGQLVWVTSFEPTLRLGYGRRKFLFDLAQFELIKKFTFNCTTQTYKEFYSPKEIGRKTDVGFSIN